jgi:asparagine N-glycosylation enzyme membrane subunit Stt3
MNWGKVFYIFFTLMSLTTSVSFLYEHTIMALFAAASINFVSSILKLGVRNLLSAELLAGSLVADLHLIPSLWLLHFGGAENINLIRGLVIGAIIANIYTLIISIVESAKSKEDF